MLHSGTWDACGGVRSATVASRQVPCLMTNAPGDAQSGISAEVKAFDSTRWFMDLSRTHAETYTVRVTYLEPVPQPRLESSQMHDIWVRSCNA